MGTGLRMPSTETKVWGFCHNGPMVVVFEDEDRHQDVGVGWGLVGGFFDRALQMRDSKLVRADYVVVDFDGAEGLLTVRRKPA